MRSRPSNSLQIAATSRSGSIAGARAHGKIGVRRGMWRQECAEIEDSIGCEWKGGHRHEAAGIM